MPNYKRIGAVDVTCRILRHLSQQTQPVSGMDISEALNIPQPTVMTHLATLADHSFVEAQGERYVVGQGIAVIHARRKAYLSVVANSVNKQTAELSVEPTYDSFAYGTEERLVHRNLTIAVRGSWYSVEHIKSIKPGVLVDVRLQFDTGPNIIVFYCGGEYLVSPLER